MIPSNRQVWPAVELAGISSWSSRFYDLLPGWRLEVSGAGTDCNSTVGPLKAFDMRCTTGQSIGDRIVERKRKWVVCTLYQNIAFGS
jgi:hypothetical protein